jgi:hypothetical protein
MGRRVLLGTGLMLAVWAALAYGLLPDWWRLRLRGVAIPDRLLTTTPAGLPGDPLNVALTASREGVAGALDAAGWVAADPLTARTAARIAADVALDRPYPAAPVSALLWQGRTQDLAWEKPEGGSPDRRLHLRLWSAGQGRLWLGTVSLDAGVELGHLTGQVTHRIDPDLDAARSALVADLDRAGQIGGRWSIPGAIPLSGRNGGGDPWSSDGTLLVLALREAPPP